MEIRKACNADLKQLLILYTHLHDSTVPVFDKSLENLWDDILSDKNHHIIVGFVNEQLVSSCVLVVMNEQATTVTTKQPLFNGFNEILKDKASVCKRLVNPEDCNPY